jgi:hypothetical protein
MFSLFRKINNIKIILYNTREYPVQKRKWMQIPKHQITGKFRG